MARIPTLLLLCVALLASASAKAAGVPELRGGTFTVNGVYSLNFNLSLATRLPAGTIISCRAQIVPNQGGSDLRNPQLAAIPARSGGGTVSITGTTATCATEIPFSWTMTGARGEAVLSYEIYAVSDAGSVPTLVRSSTRQNIPVPIPAAGGSAGLNLNLIF